VKGQRKIAYADPPYPGMAEMFYSHDPKCAEVDHGDLMQMLDRDFESWALSTASVTLAEVLRLAPAGVRIAAWVKSFASFKPGVNPAYAWEPVLFKTANRSDRTAPTVPDFVSCPITLKRGLVGAKPEGFCFWLFDLLGAHPDDEFHDLYPGSGAVQRAWDRWRELKCPETTPLFSEASP
jgi:hypothetical protein